ncbi:18589_t:CDS:2 [Racocetra fulgida]|uniref:18589_t:CDS:1 n=1 Tax=Racocetra fulgida TaxID=60492 RepID=A0A9N8ZLJ2_9GLOM|nr:18589_t:CDS:2 [Racocetra fulgida]
MSKVYTARIQTTSRVLSSSSSLCDLVKALDERLEKDKFS